MNVPTLRTRAMRLLLWCALAAVLWGAVVALTGGFNVRVAGLRISSRNARPAAATALLMAFTALLMSTAAQRAVFWSRVRAALVARPGAWSGGLTGISRTVASSLAAALAIVTFVSGVTRGAPYAGGADSWGYVSQAELWLHGHLRIEQPLMRELPWSYVRDALTPIGYAPTTDGGPAIVPIYPPGLPLVMAVLQSVGGRRAVFLAVPFLAACAVWATYLLGTRVGGSLVGLSAAVLLASSPVFVCQYMLPMGDVPVTAWWMICLLCAGSTSRRAAFASGCAAGIAILTRPNLLPLFVVPAALVVWPRSDISQRERGARVAVFIAAVGAFCVFFAIANWRLFGSPLVSGYGSPRQYFSWQHLRPNFEQYPGLIAANETPLLLLALLTPVVVWAARGRLEAVTKRCVAALVVFVVGLGACYAWYDPPVDWWFLRYLLPAFPPLFILTSTAIVWLATRVARRAALVAAALVIALIVWQHATVLDQRDAFSYRENERKVEAIGQYVAAALPQNAVFISCGYSGSVRYYSGRLTVRYDWIPPDQLDRSIADLRGIGLHPYILLDDHEQYEFRARFVGHSPLGPLDWQPVAWLRHSTRVFIFDPAERQNPSPRGATIIF